MDVQRVWVVRAGKGGVWANEFEQRGEMVVGFAPVPDLTGATRQRVMELARAEFGEKGGSNAGGQLDAFANQIAADDLVITPERDTRELLYGRASGQYRFLAEPAFADHRHARGVEWLGRRDRDMLPERALFSLGSTLTVFKPEPQDGIAHFLLTGEVDPGRFDVDGAGGEPGEAVLASTAADEQENRNKELIAKRIRDLGWAETQELVAGVLRALGYATQVSLPGADGGVDVIACQDPLFLRPPVVKVQVKARPETNSPPSEVRALLGILDPDDRGIFVSTGGFTGSTEKEVDGNRRVQLLGMDRLVELVLEHYDALDDEVRSLIPLRRIWVLADEPD